MIITQTCPCCGQTKETNTDNFYRSKMTDSGYSIKCRACYVAEARAEAKAEEAELRAERRKSGLDEVSTYLQRRAAERREYYREKAIKDNARAGSKPCTQCGEIKPFSAFYGDKNNKVGYSSWCRECKADEYRAKKLLSKYTVPTAENTGV